MNVLTATTIQSYYPKLILTGEALNGVYKDPGYSVARSDAIRHGITIYESTAHWSSPCGQSCPKLVRYSTGFCGVGIFHWGSWSSASREPLNNCSTSTERKPFAWRLGYSCENPNCTASA